VKNQAASPSGSTTTDNGSFITLAKSGNSYTWTGTQTVTNAESAKINPVEKTTMVYLNAPMTGSYTLTAKITLTGTDTTGNTGLVFGELANPASAGETGFVNLVGLRHLSNGAFRGFYIRSSDNQLTTGNPNASLSKGSEYTYEIKWNGTNYSWKIQDNTGSVALGSTGAVFSGRQASYHPGIIVVKQTISISGLTLTLD
jgi:hypothetical protein